MGQPRNANPRTFSLLPAAGVVLGVLLLRLLYLRLACPYDLVEDEAQYWLWSRFPDWSYYSKGPGVAWAAWLSTRIFGDAEWAVRLPTAVLGAVGALAAAGLTRDVARHAWERLDDDRRAMRATPARAAVYAALAVSLAPALQVAGVLMTIDGPYVACWAVAAWAFWRVWALGEARLWAAVGAAVAAGFLFKYTMLLLVPGLALWLWVGRASRPPSRDASGPMPGGSPAPRRAERVWQVAGVALALLGLLPVLVWNAQNGWPTWAHLLGHLGLRGGDMPPPAPGSGASWSPWWVPEFVGQQLGMIGPALVLAIVAGLRGWHAACLAKRAGAQTDPRWDGQRFLLCCAAPILVFYTLVSLLAEPEGNWPMAAHATLVPLGAWWAADALAERCERRRRGLASVRGPRGLWHATIVYGIIGAAITHRADLAADALNRLNTVPAFRSAFGAVVGREPRPVVLGRLMGSKRVAASVAELMDALERSTGRRAIVIAQHYGRASQLAYELRGRSPDVLCAMAQLGGRRSQFDLWPQTSLGRADLVGRPGVVLASDEPGTREFLSSVFARFELAPGGGRLDGEHKPDRVAFLGFDYRSKAPRADIDGPGGGSRR